MDLSRLEADEQKKVSGTISAPAHRLIQNVEHQTFSEAAGVVSTARIGRLLSNSLHLY
jgi:hypothetical protein